MMNGARGPSPRAPFRRAKGESLGLGVLWHRDFARLVGTHDQDVAKGAVDDLARQRAQQAFGKADVGTRAQDQHLGLIFLDRLDERLGRVALDHQRRGDCGAMIRGHRDGAGQRLIGGGAALYFFKFKKPKADTKGGDELDEYDFGEDEDDEDEPTPEDEEPAQDKEE